MSGATELREGQRDRPGEVHAERGDALLRLHARPTRESCSTRWREHGRPEDANGSSSTGSDSLSRGARRLDCVVARGRLGESYPSARRPRDRDRWPRLPLGPSVSRGDRTVAPQTSRDLTRAATRLPCAMVEVAYEMRSVASFLVASENQSPAAGWPYAMVLASLVRNPTMVPRELANTIVERFGERYATPPADLVVCISQRREARPKWTLSRARSMNFANALKNGTWRRD